MGIEPFLISSSLVAVIAQRLVRVLCPKCAEEYVLSEEEFSKVYPVVNARRKITVKRARGCSECMMTGYKGRTGIYELLLVDDDIRSLIIQRTDSNTIKSLAVKKGMDTLKVDGIKKVLQGITTMEEVFRVTQEEIV
jgi:general secretion pathway protein E